jgi:ParB-like chromosome segregation protein Spo0J
LFISVILAIGDFQKSIQAIQIEQNLEEKEVKKVEKLIVEDINYLNCLRKTAEVLKKNQSEKEMQEETLSLQSQSLSLHQKAEDYKKENVELKKRVEESFSSSSFSSQPEKARFHLQSELQNVKQKIDLLEQQVQAKRTFLQKYKDLPPVN